MNRSGHSIVVDIFALFTKVLVRLLKIWRNVFASPHHMSYYSWTTQMEHFHEFFLNWGDSPINGLVSYNQNTKQIFVEFLVTKDTITL